MNTTHELKCVLEPFQQKWNRNKYWEYRKNDRNFQKGDTLWEREYNPLDNSFTGREIYEEVTWILEGGSFGVPEGFVIMSTKISGLQVMNEFIDKLKDKLNLEQTIPQDRSDSFVINLEAIIKGSQERKKWIE